jgi:hypothetical protein
MMRNLGPSILDCLKKHSRCERRPNALLAVHGSKIPRFPTREPLSVTYVLALP